MSHLKIRKKLSKTVRLSFIVTGTLFAVLALATEVKAVQLEFFETQFDTDWTSAGFGGMRGIGSGSITLNGVSGQVNKAYLYWHGPTNSNNANANANVLFNGTQITGSNIGFSDDNFWGFSNSQAYRADVTNLVAGNGAYSLDNFTKPDADVNGASLVTFFDDGDSTNNRDVVLFDGNDANFSNSFDPLGWDISLSGINYTGGTAYLNLGVSDGQTLLDDDLRVNGTSIASNTVFQGDSVPNGPGGPNNGGLWDIKNFDITSSLNPGNNTLNVSTGTRSERRDALSAIYVGIDLEAGSAAPTEEVPEPLTILGTLTAGAFGTQFMKKRKQMQAAKSEA